MKKLRSVFSLAILIALFSGMAFTSCGGKKEVKEEQTEEAEHPADSDSSEHPADKDSTEHPAEGGSEHPDNK
jgi:ABC-type oligopeptide transport system substrate-binding subunit